MNKCGANSTVRKPADVGNVSLYYYTTANLEVIININNFIMFSFAHIHPGLSGPIEIHYEAN